MKTYTLFITIFAICAIQAIIGEQVMKCHSSCFEGCSFGVCKKTTSCIGCSRKYNEDKQSAKDKINLMKKKDEEKIEDLKDTLKEEMEELKEKHTGEIFTWELLKQRLSDK